MAALVLHAWVPEGRRTALGGVLAVAAVGMQVIAVFANLEAAG